jgi:polysaccharide pyruvyl transferase WcaK-like protein
MPKEILFTGYYGFENYGDDLFGVACIHGAKLVGCSFVPVILSPPIKGTLAKYVVPRALARSYQNDGAIGKILRAYFMIYGCLRYREVVLAGGSVISSGSSNRMRHLQYLLGKIGFCRLSAIGISVGPFLSEKDRIFAKKFINNLSYLSVRDVASVEQCDRLKVNNKVHLHADLAGCAPLGGTRPGKKDQGALGVCLCRYESVTGLDERQELIRNSAIFDGIRDFSTRNNIKVKIFVLNANDDIGDSGISIELNRYLSMHGISSEVVPYSDPLSTLASLRLCRVVLSVRLHGGISAYLLNVPFVLVEYHKKCSDFLDFIGQDARFRVNADVSSAAVVFDRLAAAWQCEQEFKCTSSSYMEKSRRIFREAPWCGHRSS